MLKYFKTNYKVDSEAINSINNFFDELNLIKEENRYTSLFKNKNLILIQVESLEYFNITKEIMPTLYNLMNSGWNFANYYNNTIGAAGTLESEFVTQTGLNPYKNIYKTNFNYNKSIANIFKYNGYVVNSFHNNKGLFYNRKVIHEKIGFDNHYSLKDMYDNINYYNDSAFFEKNEFADLIIPSQEDKFYSFIVTISAHGPYKDNYFCTSEIDVNVSEQDCFRYLSNQTDNFFKLLLDNLKEKKLYDETVIIIYSDHYSYSYNPTEKEQKYYTYYSEKIRNIPFIIWSSDLEKKVFLSPLNMSDSSPTILNLFGLEYNLSDYIGIDYFSVNHPKIAYFKNNSWYDGSKLLEYGNNKEYEELYKYVKNKNLNSDLITKNSIYYYN